MITARAIYLTTSSLMLQVRSLVQGDKSLPKNADAQQPGIAKYDEIVEELEDPYFTSKFVKVYTAEPSTPPAIA